MVDEALDEGLLEKATIANLIKRVNAMKILLFLSKDLDKEEAYYLQHIADSLDMNEATTFNNLNILIQAGVGQRISSGRSVHRR